MRPRWPLLIAAGALLAALYMVVRTALSVPAPQALAAGNALLAHRKVLVVAAHPDDVEWYLGGTLRRLVLAGAEVDVLVLSNGERGPNKTRVPDLAATRRAEQQAAARVIGYTRLIQPGLPDRGVAKDPRLRPELEALYRELRPDAVFVFDPSLPALPYLHTDHQGSARVFLAFWRGLGAGRPPVYLFQTRRPDVAVDISAVMDTKVRALARHVTQNGGSGEDMRAFYGGRAVGVRYAELFRELR